MQVESVYPLYASYFRTCHTFQTVIIFFQAKLDCWYGNDKK